VQDGETKPKRPIPTPPPKSIKPPKTINSKHSTPKAENNSIFGAFDKDSEQADFWQYEEETSEPTPTPKEQAPIVSLFDTTPITDHKNQSQVNQLTEELMTVLIGKAMNTDQSKIKLLDDRIDSIIAQFGKIGYDVIFTNDTETEFTLNRFSH